MKKLILLFSVLIVLASCGGKNNKKSEAGSANLSGDVKIDGSSTVYPLSEAVAEEFRNEAPEVKVTVGESGTGGGFKKFTRGETDLNDASRPITASEIEASKQAGIDFIELPVAYDGLAVVVNKSNTFVDKLTVEELKKIWEPAAQGKIKSWKQVRASFPDEPLNLYGPGTASGTYDYFTEAVVGKAKSSRGDYNASEDDNVLVKGVSTDKGGLAFFGLSYYENNRDQLKLVPVDGGKGAIAPSAETVKNGTYQPLSRPIFIYVSSKAAARPEVKSFVKFYLQNAEKLSQEIGSIPLQTEAYQLALKKFEAMKTGTVFSEGKSTVGVSMSDLLKAEQ